MPTAQDGRKMQEHLKNTLVKCDATMHSTLKLDCRRGLFGMIAKTMCKAPMHPGGFVKAEVIAPLGLSVTDAAQALGVTRPALSKFLNAHAHLSPEMALRIEKAFGVPMDDLMHMQNSFDIAEARKREKEIKVLPFKRKARPSRGRSA